MQHELDLYDDPPLPSWCVVRNPDCPVVDLIMTGCYNCGASLYEVAHQTGDLCPMCEREPADV